MKRQMTANIRNKLPQKVSLWFLLILPSVLLITLTVGLASYVAFINGQKAVNEVAHQLRGEVSARIEDHLRVFLEIPHQVNQFNIDAIQQGWAKANDPRLLQNYFLSQVKTHSTITSVYFGNIQGGIIGSGQEESDGTYYTYETENLKAGTFNKYAITDSGTVEKLLTSIPNFDTRTRLWYSGATQKGTATWSDIYILFTRQDMAISASSPVYDEKNNLLGVVAVDISLSQIKNFLETLDISTSGQSFIMERTGLLVATSTGEKPFSENNGKLERLDISEIKSPVIKYAAEFLRERFGENLNISGREQLEFEFDKKNYFLDISPVQDQYGIDWLVVVVIPESDFMVEIKETNRTTFLIVIVALVISVLISILIARKIAARISFLNDATRAFTKDEGNAPNLTHSHIREIDELTISFKEMERQLRQTLASLKTEVGERKLVEHALRESETLFRAIFEQASVGICTLSLDGKFRRVNQRFTEIVGYGHEELLDLTFQDITHPEDMPANVVNMQMLLNDKTASYSMEKRYFRKDGSITWVNQSMSLLHDMEEGSVNFLSAVEDITARKHAEETLEAVNNELRMSLEREKLLARTDGMTGLYNHRYFFELATREFRAAKRYHRPLAVLMFDIDRFKQVNDTFGHAAGDKVLLQIAGTLASQLRTADVLSRYGGDEFIIMLPQTSAQQALPLAERIRTSVEELSIEVENIPLSITLNIGIAEIQRELTDENIEYIAKRADKALYTAKVTGRNRTVTFDPKIYD